jgi:hypothetical protein
MISKMKRAVLTVAATGLLSGVAVLSATSAYASPSNCSGVYEGNTYQAYCGKGTGLFRANARCYKIGTSNYVVRYGAWQKPGYGVRSVASCTSAEEVASGAIDWG